MNFLQNIYTESMEIQKVIAANLFAARGELSRKELAQRAKVTYQTIYDIEEGNKNPSVKALQSIADALGIPCSALLETSEPVRPIIKNEPISAFAKKLLSVPDKVYALAEKLGSDHEIWGEIIDALEDEVNILEESKHPSASSLK